MKTNPLDSTLRNLDDCSCCTGLRAETPVKIENRPGLPAIIFRAGTHGQFKASLLAALTSRNRPQLGKLRTREDDDFTIALFDGFAAMADVLTFYSERIANECFLRTATERRSVLELARAIGYELRPGVAAATWLAFTVEDAKEAPGWADIPAGTKVQSIPGPGEKAQTYETIEPLTARKEWNILKARSMEVPVPRLNQTEIRLAGNATNLKQGDAILIIGDEVLKNVNKENWDLRLVKSIEVVAGNNPSDTATIVTLDRGLGKKRGYIVSKPARENAHVYALRKRANVFGYNAPDWRSLTDDVQGHFPGHDTSADAWPNFSILPRIDGEEIGDEIDLDGIYPKIIKGDWVVISDGSYQEVFCVDEVAERGRSDYLVTGKTTRLKLSGEWDHLDKTHVRESTVFCEMEELPWAPSPVEEPVQGSTVQLDSAVEGLLQGKVVLLRGKRSRVRLRSKAKLPEFKPESGKSRPLVEGEELIVLKSPSDSGDHDETLEWNLQDSTGTAGTVETPIGSFDVLPAREDDELLVEVLTLRNVRADMKTLEFVETLKNSYDPASVEIFANVAFATHGESVKEIVGSGDASQGYQEFALKQLPVTFVPASTPTGAESSLGVYVNDVKWTEVDSLYSRVPGERIFITRRDDDGTARVKFGDGHSGAVLPSGQGNIMAKYRKGIGVEGNVRAGQLTLLLDRPLGLKSVSNPMPSGGAQDPEELDDARKNAPVQTLTLGRIVSLQDYEDFARAFGGIAKAFATWIWTPEGRGVYVTVLPPGGKSSPLTDETLGSLTKAMLQFGNPLVPVMVVPGNVTPFEISGDILVEPDRIPERVKQDIDAELRDKYRFEVRQLGQNVSMSEVIALVQRVPGVKSVSLTKFGRVKGNDDINGNMVLVANRPQVGAAIDAAVRAVSNDDIDGDMVLVATRSQPGAAIGAAEHAEILILDEKCLPTLKTRIS